MAIVYRALGWAVVEPAPQTLRRNGDCGTPQALAESEGPHDSLGHWSWVQGVGQKVARLTSHPLSLFCPQGFTCKSRVNREYLSDRGGQAAFPPSRTLVTRVTLSSLPLHLPASPERDPPDVPVQHLVHKGKAPSSPSAAPCQTEARVLISLEGATCLSKVATPAILRNPHFPSSTSAFLSKNDTV